VVADLRRVLSTGCWWGHSPCQRQVQRAEKGSMQDLQNPRKVVRPGRAARARRKGSYEGQPMVQTRGAICLGLLAKQSD